MFSIHKHSYLHLKNSYVDPRIINRCVDRAREIYEITDPFDFHPPFYRLTSAQPNIPIDNVDVTRRPEAFGRWALPKLRRELHAKDQSVVVASLTSICDLVQDSERAYEAIELRIPDRLADLLLDSLSPIRERAALALSFLASIDTGKEAIVSNFSLLENLKLCLGDAQAAVRMKTATCLQIISETWMSADVLVENEFIEYLLGHVQREVEEIMEIHLMTLKGLMYGCGKCVALENDAFKIFMKFLDHTNTSIVCKALDCLAVLTSTPKGKTLAIENALLDTLNRLLHYGETEVCKSAAAVIMFCTIKTKAKILAAEIKGLPKRLLKLASSVINPSLQMYSIKALTNICEHPLVRKQMREHHVLHLQNLQVSEDNVDYKKTLLRVVDWCPEKHDCI